MPRHITLTALADLSLEFFNDRGILAVIAHYKLCAADQPILSTDRAIQNDLPTALQTRATKLYEDILKHIIKQELPDDPPQ